MSSGPCRRCAHDGDRHRAQYAAGRVIGCQVSGCPCIVYRPPRWWHRALDAVRGVL